MRIAIAGVAALYWPIAIAEGLRSRSDAELVAFSTLGQDPEVVRDHLGIAPEEFAARYGVVQYDDPEEMMQHEDPDAVAIVTRHTEHARWAEQLARFGKPLYIAKSFATSTDDAERIVAAGRDQGIHIAVGPSARFLPGVSAARQAVAAGRIGTPFSMRICHHHGTIDVFGQRDFYRQEEEGGPELSLGWYVADLVLEFLQSSVVRVSAEYANFTSPDSPFMDCGRMVLRMRSGAMASCDMYFCNRFPFPVWEMEIVGERGAILLRQEGEDMGTSRAYLLSADGREELEDPEPKRHWELFWVDDLASGRAPALTAEYAAKVLEVSLAAREAARSATTVQLGDD